MRLPKKSGLRVLIFISFFALICIVLILTPQIWQFSRENQQLSRENRHLQTGLAEAQKTVSETQRQAEYYRMASEHAPDGIVVQDMSGRILWSNPAFSRIHGRSAEEVRGKHPLEFAMPSDRTPDAEEIAKFSYNLKDKRLDDFEIVENRRANGDLFWNQLSVSFSKFSNGREAAIQVCRDVTKQIEQANVLRKVSHQLEHEARHDGLTGASNRAAFQQYFRQVVDDPDAAPVGLLHIDLDNFKSINDTHGHSAGDAVLVHVAEILQACVRPIDMVARIGGDEFVITCPSVPDLEFLNDVACDLIDKLSKPFEWYNCVITNEASIGAAISGDSPVAEDLLAQADFALYEAKREGRNRATLYDEAMHERHEAQIVRTQELADAVEAGAMDYFFQPKMDLTSGDIVGVETLIRWNHVDDGLVLPDDFLPMVKGLGLMGGLDLHSMSAALSQKQRLKDAGFNSVGVAFNASPELLAHPDFIDRLIWGADAANLDRSQITIEVLETTDFGNATEATSHAAVIRHLRTSGFQVHLDDFGIGFAGLSHLATLDVTGVKIDRSLVRDLLTEETSQKIVRKIVELSNDLGLMVIAEGVEDSRTALALQEMGCNVIQGYWLSKPMPASALHSWLDVRARLPFQALE